jgi:hypothetical protein
MNYFMFIVDSPPLINAAQRLAAQPLGRFRYVVTILAGNL